MLRGQFEVTIDDKGRLVMPSRCQSDFALKPDEKDPVPEQETEDEADPEGKEASELKSEEGKKEEVRKLKGRLIIAPNLMSSGHCLLVYPVDAWEVEERALEARFEGSQVILDTLLGMVSCADLDMKGRFAVPSVLFEHIGLKTKELSKSKFYLVGKKGRFLELWKKELWDEECRIANEAMQKEREASRAQENLKQADQNVENEATTEAVQELIKETKARKEAMKQKIKEAFLAERENKALLERGQL